MNVSHNEFCPPKFVRANLNIGAGAAPTLGCEVLRLALPNASTMLELQREIRGVALGGTLPPGTYALVTPWEQRAFLSITNDPHVLVMRPGDAFAVNWPQGVAAKIVSPYAWVFPAGIYGTPLQFTESAEAALYCFLDPAQVCNVSYRRLPGIAYSSGTVPTALPSSNLVETLDTGALSIPCDAQSALIHLFDTNDGSFQRLSGDCSYELYWLTETRLWAHNGSDDFDAGGTGIANAMHDAELFEVHGCRAVYLRQLVGSPGGQLTWVAIFGW